MISTDNIKEVPRAEWPDIPATGDHRIRSAYRNMNVVVLEYHMKIWWRFRRVKIRHLAIRTRDSVMINKFYSLMDIKNQICGEDCPAVQVYPKESEIMDSANMTHLFVFPEGFKMPLTLQRNW